MERCINDKKYNIWYRKCNFKFQFKEQNFILENIINSPEWLGNALIDTGYISRDEAIKIVKDRTNHCNDKIIDKFWNNYNDYAQIDERVLNLIQE